MTVLKKASQFLASYKLSCVLFLLLLLLTYLGTLYQVEHGLYQSQQKYFGSLFLIHWFYGVFPIPLPGGYLLMTATFINLFWGAITRFRFQWSKVGFMLIHAGILLLLAGAFIAYVYSTEGRMVLFEGEASREIENPYAWEIGFREVTEQNSLTENIIHQRDFVHLTDGKSREFTFEGIPFTLELQDFMPNAVQEQEGSAVAARPPEKEYLHNMAGIKAILKSNVTEEKDTGEVWAGNPMPTILNVRGRTWSIALRRERIQLPFAIRLDKFIHKTHPGTDTPSEFSSEITKVEDGVSQQFKITLNEPFRYGDYTFYQSSWGQQGDGMNTQFYSVLSVMKNPADQAPLYACVITTIGLILHYVRKLALYLRKERAQQS